MGHLSAKDSITLERQPGQLTPSFVAISMTASGILAVFLDLFQVGGYFNLPRWIPILRSIDSPNPVLTIIPFLLFGGLMLGLLSDRLTSGALITNFVSAFALLFVLSAMLPDSDLGLNLEFWSGFGLAPTSVTFLCGAIWCIPKIFSLRIRAVDKVLLIRIAKFGSSLTLLLYLPIFIQPRNGLLNFGDTSYHVVDELLSQYSGKFPYSDYSPQYTGVLGWLLSPLGMLNPSGEQMMTAVIITCNVLGMSLPILAALIIKRLFPSISYLLVLATCIAASFPSGEFNGSSTMLKEFSYSARLMPILVTILILMIHLKGEKSSRIYSASAVGIFSALSALNNADIGLAFALSVLLVIAVLTLLKRIPSSSLLWSFLWFSGTILIYCLIGSILGKPVSFDSYWGLKANSPRTLYGTFPLHAFGSHILAMAVCIASIAVGVYSARRPESTRAATAKAGAYLICGLLLAVVLVRFAIRPIPQGMPGVLIPTFVPGAMLVVDILELGKKLKGRGSGFQMLLMTVFASIPLGALWQYPNPVDELRRISGNHAGTTNWSSTPGRVSDGYSIDSLNLREALAEIDRIKNALPTDSEIGYFGIHGHTVQLLSGVQNLMGIPAPESLRFGSSQESLACRPLQKNGTKFALVYGSRFPCQGFVRDDQYSLGSIHVYRKT